MGFTVAHFKPRIISTTHAVKPTSALIILGFFDA